MTELSEHQFEILPNESAVDGFVFGIGAAVSVDEEGFDPGENTWMTQDAENTRRGVLGFGRDVMGPRTWIWDSHVDQRSVDTAVATLEDFAYAWSPEELLRSPGEVTCLRYRIAGRTRRVFGRPRRFAAPPSNLILGGYVPVNHEFQTVDAYTYDDVESSVNIPYSSVVSGGGFVLPKVMPLQTAPNINPGEGQVVVGGRARAYPVFRLNGPWTNPVIETDDWTLRWKGTVPTNGWVEIDTRPWRLTVLNHLGASAAGGLDRRTWLEDTWFAPNTRPQMRLEGTAESGDASLLVRWRNTWTSL